MSIIIKLKSSRGSTASSLSIVLLLFLVLLTFVAIVLCDDKSTNNKNEGDRPRQEETEVAAAAANSAEQQAQAQQQLQQAEPEYIKRELRDIVQRQIDKDGDGQVSYEELKNYLTDLHEKNIDFNVDKQWSMYQPQIHEVFSWEGYEPEKKEVLTWDHYYNQTYPELIGIDVGIPIQREQDTASILTPPEERDKNLDEEEKEKKKRGEGEKTREEKRDEVESEEDLHFKALKQMVFRADARWKLADENGDTLLTKQEFKSLLHPDEGHEGLQELFIKEATEDMDLNKDNKICLDEFMKHLKVLASDQERNDQNWLSSQQENFGRFLDKNKDGILDGEEIKNWLVPTKSVKFSAEAKRLLDIGDVNEDHKLSNAELMEHYEHFLNLLPADYWKSASDLQEGDSILINQNQYERHEEL